MSAPDLNSWLGYTQYCLGICPASMAMSNDEIVATVTAALETAIQLVEDDDWNDEIAEDGAVVKSKINKEGRKIFLCKAKVNVAPKVLEKKMMDIDNLTSWNKTITESRILKNLKKDVFVSYQVTAEGALAWSAPGTLFMEEGPCIEMGSLLLEGCLWNMRASQG